MTSKPALSSRECLLARRWLGKLSSLEQGRADPESVFSGLYFAASVSLLRQQTSRPAPRASIPESGPSVSLHFPSLANTFLGQSGPVHEEADCRSVPRAMLWYLVEGTLHLQWAPGEEWRAAPLLQKSQSGEQSSLCQKEENSNRMHFQAVAGPPHVRAPRKKNANFGP